jgi:hypothetical protein
MKNSKGFSQCRVPAFMAMLLAIVTVLMLPAYGQQEVDPGWYDPWAPNTAAVHTIQPASAVHSSRPVTGRRDQQVVKSAATAADTRGKDSQSSQSRHNAAQKKDVGTLSAESQAQ